jgi:hypothetical protein
MTLFEVFFLFCFNLTIYEFKIFENFFTYSSSSLKQDRTVQSLQKNKIKIKFSICIRNDRFGVFFVNIVKKF